jgi:hypothetical protein
MEEPVSWDIMEKQPLVGAKKGYMPLMIFFVQAVQFLVAAFRFGLSEAD